MTENNKTPPSQPLFTVEYVREADALLIRFARPRPIVLDHFEGSDQGVCVGLDPESGRVKALSVLRFRAQKRHESEPLRSFLEYFGVTIPGVILREIDGLDRAESGA